MEIEEMKSQWQEGKDALRSAGTLPDRRRKTSLARLADRYFRMASMALIAGSCALLPLYRIGGLGLALAYLGLMLTAAAIDFSFYRAVCAIRPARMSVDEVYRRTLTLRRRHLQSIALLLPMALTWVLFFVWANCDDRYMMYGVATGGVVGLVCGLNVLRRFLSDYRDALEE